MAGGVGLVRAPQNTLGRDCRAPAPPEAHLPCRAEHQPSRKEQVGRYSSVAECLVSMREVLGSTPNPSIKINNPPKKFPVSCQLTPGELHITSASAKALGYLRTARASLLTTGSPTLVAPSPDLLLPPCRPDRPSGWLPSHPAARSCPWPPSLSRTGTMTDTPSPLQPRHTRPAGPFADGPASLQPACPRLCLARFCPPPGEPSPSVRAQHFVSHVR